MTNPLQEGWREVPLSDVSEIRVSNVDKKTNVGEIPVRLCNYIDVYNNEYITASLDFMEATATPSELARFSVEVGDVMITKDSETPDDIGVPAVAVWSQQWLVCGYHLALFKPDKDRVDPVFLAKQLGLPRIAAYYGRLACGSTRYGLSNSGIARTPVRLPPIEQQRKIARILTTLDNLIGKTESLIAKYQAIKQGMMHDLFTRGVDAHGHLRPTQVEAPDLYKETDLGWIPKEWASPSVGQVLVHRPKNGYSPKESNEWTGTLMLGLGCLTPSGFEPIQLKHAPRNDPNLLPALLKDGDLLISRSNTRDLVALVGIYRDIGTPCIYSDLMMRLMPNAEILPDYLEAVLRHAPVRRQLTNASCGTSGSMMKVNAHMVVNTVLALPARDEQQRILDRAASISRFIMQARQEREKLRVQKTGLMQDLLTGKVRVKADDTEGVVL